MITLKADSGSTKTEWKLSGDNINTTIFTTQGINPFHMTGESITSIINSELLPQIENLVSIDKVEEVYFYGAGCNETSIPTMLQILRNIFTHNSKIEVASDLLGAAKALCADKEGIACILGTGANSCLYNGVKITENISPMGYILGDEGSGAVIGRTFVNELYKGKHRDFINVFEAETGLTLSSIIQRTYREPMPNRFLASLTVFIKKHIDKEEWIHNIVVDCLRLFFKKNISHYSRKDLNVSFVGSIAYYFREQLEEAAESEGYKIGVILRKPIDNI